MGKINQAHLKTGALCGNKRLMWQKKRQKSFYSITVMFQNLRKKSFGGFGKDFHAYLCLLKKGIFRTIPSVLLFCCRKNKK